MTNMQPLTPAERFARALLAAWNSGELARLEAALDAAASVHVPALSSSEEEKIELVREIAGTIGIWLEGVRRDTPTNLHASLKLLRHLARCENIRDDRWMDEALEGVCVAKEFPQAETPAFVRN